MIWPGFLEPFHYTLIFTCHSMFCFITTNVVYQCILDFCLLVAFSGSKQILLLHFVSQVWSWTQTKDSPYKQGLNNIITLRISTYIFCKIWMSNVFGPGTWCQTALCWSSGNFINALPYPQVNKVPDLSVLVATFVINYVLQTNIWYNLINLFRHMIINC